MVPSAGLFRQKAEEGRTLDALPLLRCEALKKARALWSLVWSVLVRCARRVVPTAVKDPEKACSVLAQNALTNIHDHTIIFMERRYSCANSYFMLLRLLALPLLHSNQPANQLTSSPGKCTHAAFKTANKQISKLANQPTRKPVNRATK